MKKQKGIVYEHGINDTYQRWAIENKINKIIYKKWCHMLERVYSEKIHERHPTYINATICIEWHWLSKFVEDFKKIDGYDEEKLLNGELELDKDIKSNGINKEYSLENCMFVSQSENTKQAMKTRNNNYLKGESHPMYDTHRYGKNSPNKKQIIQRDLDGNLIKIWDYAKQASEEIENINYKCLMRILSTGKSKYKGFIWEYVKNVEEDEE